MNKPLILLLLLLLPPVTQAHFLELIPSSDTLSSPGQSELTLDICFTHPMSGGPAMEMEAPADFGVVGPGGRSSLLHRLQEIKRDGARAFRANYKITQPGDHIFFLQPQPYWEASEQKMIIHNTKVVVDAFGGPELWSDPIEFPLEIHPLVRPYGLWTGNLFRGEVRKNGQPLPYATIEVEWRNDGSFTPPSDAYITQTILADANGVFSYAMPRAGWWGFAALNTADKPMKNPAGQSVPVELGALIWVKTRNMD